MKILKQTKTVSIIVVVAILLAMLPASAYAGLGVAEISFDPNGGEGDMETVYERGDYALPECAFRAPDRCEFKGWAFTADGPVIEEDTILAETDPITLYAIWQTAAAPTQPPAPAAGPDPISPTSPPATPVQDTEEVSAPPAEDKGNSEAPKTGDDDTASILWGLLLVGSAALCLAVQERGREKSKRERN